jgi:hypothetical protein
VQQGLPNGPALDRISMLQPMTSIRIIGSESIDVQAGNGPLMLPT